jgi:hypothetical protein
MKKNKIISGVVATAALCAVNASAQITYHNGDMLAGFGNGGSKDVIVDLGSISQFQQTGASPISFSGVSSALTTVFGAGYNLNTVYWSVFGANDTTSPPYDSSVSQSDPYTIWNTLARSNPNLQTSPPLVAGSSAVQSATAGDIINTIGGLTSPSEAGPGQIVNVSLDIVSVNTSLGGYSDLMNNPYNGNFQGDWTYNIQNTGAGTSDLYQSNPGNHFTQHASYLGDVVLDPSGNLTFNSAPEPSTWAMLGTGLMSLLVFNRYRRNK